MARVESWQGKHPVCDTWRAERIGDTESAWCRAEATS